MFYSTIDLDWFDHEPFPAVIDEPDFYPTPDRDEDYPFAVESAENGSNTILWITSKTDNPVSEEL